jgi:hypothetical protein
MLSTIDNNPVNSLSDWLCRRCLKGKATVLAVAPRSSEGIEVGQTASSGSRDGLVSVTPNQIKNAQVDLRTPGPEAGYFDDQDPAVQPTQVTQTLSSRISRPVVGPHYISPRATSPNVGQDSFPAMLTAPVLPVNVSNKSASHQSPASVSASLRPRSEDAIPPVTGPEPRNFEATPQNLPALAAGGSAHSLPVASSQSYHPYVSPLFAIRRAQSNLTMRAEPEPRLAQTAEAIQDRLITPLIRERHRDSWRALFLEANGHGRGKVQARQRRDLSGAPSFYFSIGEWVATHV